MSSRSRISSCAALSLLLFCAAALPHRLAAQTSWTLLNGTSTSFDPPGSYGTLGIPGGGPGGRARSSTWADSSGNIWLFGGYLSDNGTTAYNDLWKFTPSTLQWTWMSGSSTPDSPGVYGTLGVPAAGNVPGARFGAANWTDTAGNLWLFGGYSDTFSGSSALSDLWEYTPSTGLWTWVGGSQDFNPSGNYGTLGTPAAGNLPPPRMSAATWMDASGNLWLFGGMTSLDGSSLTDLWEYTPSTGEWTWVGGSQTEDLLGVDGTQGTPAPGNLPTSRGGAVAWTDSSGNFWLFGGNYEGSMMNDLWEYTPSINEWTFMGSGGPGGREGAVGWSDSSGNFWIFGGDENPSLTFYEDLWSYAPSTGSWTSDGGLASPRSYAVGWTDSGGNFWLFGGYLYDNGAIRLDFYNDLWTDEPLAATPTFTPSAGTYTFPQSVQISTTTPNATIYYSTSTSTSFQVYPGPIQVTAATTINAYAVASGFLQSATASATYSPSPAATPSFTPAAGTYTTAQNVKISTTTPNATIYYTTNGTTPNTSSTAYAGPIAVSYSETIQAIAAAPDYSNSAVASALYTMNIPVVATPTFSPAAGTYTTAQTVAISDTTTGATIHYTTDGTTPTASSPAYAGPISVSSTETLEAIAVASGYNNSVVASALYTMNFPAAATPTISPAGGTYTGAQSVTISDTTPGATIRYTTNGAPPTTSSTAYTGPISVSSTETIEAIAVASGYSNSLAVSAAYTINTPVAATPEFSPAAGTFNSAQTVTISDSTAGATVHYTTNGSTPTASSTLYTGPITVSSSETIKAIALASGYTNSAVASAAYTINLPVAAKPAFSPAAGTYDAAQTVALSDSTAGATIHYTTDGTAPTASSTAYTGPLHVSSSETIEAIAVASGFTNSAVASAAYTINLPVALPVAATPTFSIAAGTYAGAQTVAISDSTAGAAIHYTTNGTTPTASSTVYSGPITVSSSETIEAIAVASGYSNSVVASVSYTLTTPSNPAPVLSSLSPAFAASGGSAFTLTVTGTGFLSGSTVNWGPTPLATTYVSANELSAQVPAGDIASTGATAITVQTPSPGGGVSNPLDFETDSGSSADGPTFTSITATVAPGATANYPVTLPSSATGVTLTCLNLPKGAACSYSAGANKVTITTTTSTPAGTYQITLVFTETVPATSTALIVLPVFLLPLAVARRRWMRQQLFITACLCLVVLAGAVSVGCGGGSSATTGGGGSGGGGGSQSQTVTTSGVVTLIVQ